ncbi:DUF488 domain-containing protein [Pontiellaceae bacterium B12227]|nr:DUF488 domain-containing protein [Pontiellaceae bacterium B12227]
MFKRQQVLLGLLEQFGGELTRTQLQKLLFLHCERSASPIFEFVPYRFGCFSFQAYADKGKLADRGFLEDCKSWKLKVGNNCYLEKLDYETRQNLWQLEKRFGGWSAAELIQHVYTSYPYYAIYSEIAGKHLNASELEIVQSANPINRGLAVCSIGYEGYSLEGYLNQLIRRGVKVLCDVRKNPLSRKFGFSKSALRNALEHLGIEYRHIPQLGIVSAKRQQLDSQKAYDTLFSEYERTTLQAEAQTITELVDLLKSKKRVAFLCYEKLPEQCHRTRIVNSVLKQLGKNVAVYSE